jgi:hypothetical protein
MKQTHFLAAVAMLGLGSSLGAAPAPTPDLFKSLLACRSVADSSARLACYDGKVAALDSAAAKGDVAVIDTETVKRQRKENFGRQFSHITKAILPMNDKDVAEVDVVVRSAQRNGDGGWVMTMTDGSRWMQTDSTLLGREPRSGSKAKIRKGALSTHKMVIDGGPAIKARRIG